MTTAIDTALPVARSVKTTKADTVATAVAALTAEEQPNNDKYVNIYNNNDKNDNKYHSYSGSDSNKSHNDQDKAKSLPFYTDKKFVASPLMHANVS